MKKTKTSTERVARARQRAKAMGRVRREYYATPKEHEKLKETLRGMRDA